MKKQLKLMLAISVILIVLVGFACNASAETVASGSCGDSVTYVLDDEGTLTISGTGAMTEYASKEDVPWYGSKDTILKVIVEEGVGTIGDYSFCECGNLTQVSLPDTITKVENYGFYKCTALKELVLPDSVTIISPSAFAYSGIVEFTIPKNVTALYPSAFFKCASLEYLTIPAKTIYEPMKAFDSFGGMNSALVIRGYDESFAQELAQRYSFGFESLGAMPVEAVFEGTVTDTITWHIDTYRRLNLVGSGKMADYSRDTYMPWFMYLSTIKDVVISDEITYIGQYSLARLSNVATIRLGAGVESIGDHAFYNSQSVKEIIFNDVISSIDDYAFAKTTFNEFNIPKTVTSLGRNLFSECTSLTSVTIPDSITEIPPYTFHKCTALKNVNIEGQITTIGNNAFLYALNDVEFVIPDSVTTIEYSAFSNSGITGVDIPDSVTSIGNSAFSVCKYLTSIVIPDSVTDLGSSVFNGCSKLESVTLPKNLTAIPASMFVGCTNLKTIDFSNIRTIGPLAFKNSLSGEVVLPEGMEEVGESAFAESNLTSMVLPSTVKKIGTAAFSKSDIKTITLPDGLEEVGDNAFNNCEYIERVEFPSSVKTMGTGVFYSSNVKEVVFGSGVEIIKDNFFYNADQLETVILPDTLKEFGNNVFKRCTALKSIVIPEGISEIPEATFDSCTSLAEVTIPQSVKFIEDAFYNVPAQLVVKGYTNSYAEFFAEENDYEFVSLGEAEYSIIASGKVGSNGLTWEIDNLGELRILGEGTLSSMTSVPWNSYIRYVKSIVFSDGIQSVQAMKIDKHVNLEKVTFGYNVYYIGSDFFKNVSDTVVYEGYTNSIAEYVINKNGLTFKTLGEMPFKAICTGTNDEIQWTIFSDGTLELSGGTSVSSYSSVSFLPWSYYVDYIKRINVCEGVKSINNIHFDSYPNLEELDLHYSVTYIYKELKNIENEVVVKGYTYSIGEFYANEAGLEFVSVGITPEQVLFSGKFGDNVKFSVDSRGTLVLSGTGETKYCYYTDDLPWCSRRNYIKKLVVEEGVNLVNKWLGCDHKNIKSIEMHYSVLDGESFSGFAEGTTITGYTGSYAQRLAEELNLEFISLGIMPDEAILSGTIDNISWSLNGYGKLTLSGEGAVKEYSASSYPWYSYQTMITELYIEDGITVIPSKVLGYYDDYAVSKVTLPPSVTSFTNNGLARGAVIYCYQYSYGHDFATSKGYACEFLGVAPETLVAEGTFGDSITWQYTSHRKLKIDGTGYMPTDISIPWADYLKKVETIEMTGSIASIAPSAFKNSVIKSITIPSSITGIADKAFSNCDYLTEITISDTVIAIADTAFWDCDSLEKITLPSYLILANFTMVDECNNLKTICGRDDTFAQRLAENIGAEFVFTGEAPERVYMYGNITDTIRYEVDNLGDMTVVGEGEIPDYAEYTAYLTDNTDTLIISGTVTKIGAYAFSGFKGIKTIELEEGVTEIGESAFRYTGITEMTLPSTVTTLGAFAFADCDEMEYMYLNDNVEAIPEGLFRYCQSLKAVEVPTSVTSFGADVFDYVTEPVYLHYAGSQKQWDAIAFEENLPENIMIVYNSLLPQEVSIQDISARKSTTKVTVNLYPQLKGGEAAYIAGYTSDGILIDLVRINPATESYTLDRKVEVVKVFVWNSIEDFNPLTEVYEKEF